MQIHRRDNRRVERIGGNNFYSSVVADCCIEWDRASQDLNHKLLKPAF
jgi:hypothetical protein